MVEDFQSWLDSNDLEKLFSDKRDKETIDKEMFLFVRSNDFDNYFSYDGELGALYEKEGTLLRVWTPTAKFVEVWIYADDSFKGPSTKIEMVQKPKGIFEAYLPGDQHGTIYVYKILFLNNRESISVDPYARATTVNGMKSVIADLNRTNPDGWGERLPAFGLPEEAIIYELHIRDFSISETSGIVNKGKFLGLTEKNTQNASGRKTGLDYLIDLGITHIQILPMFDYATVDEANLTEPQYNWGYDPLNYNVPEGSYSTDPFDPFNRIFELKQMIRTLHENGLRVIMDVVYNHVYDPKDQALERTVPGYFYRYNADGSLANGTGVGNDTASERHMMRKYIIDSVKYWAKEYHLDGFRFDLMGIHDSVTMNAIREALDKIDPSIIIIGEGWEMSTPLPEDLKASQRNAQAMPRIAHFNDSIRIALKGSDFGDEKDRGFISGKNYLEDLLLRNIKGAMHLSSHSSYVDPEQVIQYVEAHDNLTLYDKLLRSNPDDSEEVRIKRHTLATSIVLLSQGVPFIHGGQEFLRTKAGVANSYQSPDEINQFEWERVTTFQESVAYVKGLIALRKSEYLFRLHTHEEIDTHFTMLSENFNIVAFSLTNSEKKYIVIFNGNRSDVIFRIQKGKYAILVEDNQVFLESMPEAVLMEKILVKAHTTSVLCADNQYEGDLQSEDSMDFL
ncbi:immunoglobulin e-set [Trichococcus flocculiformis]|uniref:Immunoglobulin e-set n=1 Tax=Trichococcus flocculiformis TaxID=82803 RepID=A0AB38BHL1_9LACT|nr:type I pullulanase [Trichococcus flocculiformis]NCB64972.1 type I pullulanase [Bacilli bacterium]CZQ93490.1 immunoglobulin e-set [Trichococcus flocculiformis]SFH75924.1 pullulanase [Trichococcus flocculiformis]